MSSNFRDQNIYKYIQLRYPQYSNIPRVVLCPLTMQLLAIPRMRHVCPTIRFNSDSLSISVCLIPCRSLYDFLSKDTT